MFDLAVIGAGPAGCSAAVNARKRGKSVVVIGSDGGALSRAESIQNYAGIPEISGEALLQTMRGHAEKMGAELRSGVIHQILPMGDQFAIGLGADFLEARRVILCTGARQPHLLPGEKELLGHGVSYCGTCDGMLYRGRRVAVLAESSEAVAEANFLAGLAASVTWFGPEQQGLDDRILRLEGKPEAILGERKTSGLRCGAEEIPFDGIFIFRETAALSLLLPELQMEGNYIAVDRQMRTSVPGVYAAGDCTGLPLQVAKAVGEGCIAALHACMSL